MIETIIQYGGAFSAVTLFAGAIWKLFRILQLVMAGQKCILRKQMLDTYYKCKDSGEIRQYQYENFIMSYHAYKSLGGNSFIDHIKEEVDEFEVVS